MWGCVIIGIVLAAVIIVLMDPILGLIGASEDTRELTGLVWAQPAADIISILIAAALCIRSWHRLKSRPSSVSAQ